MPLPDLSWTGLSPDVAFYYLTLAVTVVAGGLVVALTRTRLGRLLQPMADSPVGLATCGTSLTVTRVLVFCISAALAGIAGALAGVAQGAVDPTSYSPIDSLTYFALIVIVPGRAPWNAFVAALSLTIIPSYITGRDVPQLLQLLFGVFAIIYAIQPATARRLPSGAREFLDRWFTHGSHGPGRPEPPSADPAGPAAVAPARAAEGSLVLRDLSVRYAGLVAAEGLSLTARTGCITGLIGPNGAGKTSTFNAISGLVRPFAGTIALDGRDISRLGTSARARRGLGRTFQAMELFDSLTVAENVSAGAEGALAGPNPLRHLLATRRDNGHIARATARALEVCGLRRYADAPVATLSTGQRRLVALARCLTGPFHLLLLDEPSAGLDAAESAQFGDILRRVVAERGIGILLVEHDMSLVMAVCSSIYVMDFGRLVYHGTPAEVQRSAVVKAAYLGESSVEGVIAVSQRAEAAP
jgi:ABC-type branched-subunit amino acid transport system ATPase component